MTDSEPRTVTLEESLDRCVELGVEVGPARGVFVGTNGPLPDAPEGSLDSRPGLALIFWRPDPGEGPLRDELTSSRTTVHDGRLFLHFGLTEEAGMALLVQLADVYGLKPMPNEPEEASLAS